jgi:hypothetical protein
MAPRQQWRAKVVSEDLKETRVEVAEEQEAANAELPIETEANRSDRPTTPVGPVDEGSIQDRFDQPATPVRSVKEGLVQTGAGVPAPSHSCSEVPAPTNDEEEMLDYEPSLI